MFVKTFAASFDFIMFENIFLYRSTLKKTWLLAENFTNQIQFAYSFRMLFRKQFFVYYIVFIYWMWFLSCILYLPSYLALCLPICLFVSFCVFIWLFPCFFCFSVSMFYCFFLFLGFSCFGVAVDYRSGGRSQRNCGCSGANLFRY